MNFLVNFVPATVESSITRELTGISIAATRGEITPKRAAIPPAKL